MVDLEHDKYEMEKRAIQQIGDEIDNEMIKQEIMDLW